MSDELVMPGIRPPEYKKNQPTGIQLYR